MSEFKHTPGPWQVGCQHGLQKLEIANANYSKAIATVWAKQSKTRREDGRQVFEADPEGEANCRLIAAAPDLRDALAALLDQYTSLVNSGDAGFWDCEQDSEVVAARAAIAKATGEPT